MAPRPDLRRTDDAAHREDGAAVVGDLRPDVPSRPAAQRRVPEAPERSTGPPIDIYGKDNPHGFAGYRGSLPPTTSATASSRTATRSRPRTPPSPTTSPRRSSTPSSARRSVSTGDAPTSTLTSTPAPSSASHSRTSSRAGTSSSGPFATTSGVLASRSSATRSSGSLNEHQFFPHSRVVHGHRFAERRSSSGSSTPRAAPTGGAASWKQPTLPRRRLRRQVREVHRQPRFTLEAAADGGGEGPTLRPRRGCPPLSRVPGPARRGRRSAQRRAP